jgi:hypothetical protein
VDRPPFPLAKNVDVPVYFTVEPGGAYVYAATSLYPADASKFSFLRDHGLNYEAAKDGTSYRIRSLRGRKAGTIVLEAPSQEFSSLR